MWVDDHKAIERVVAVLVALRRLRRTAKSSGGGYTVTAVISVSIKQHLTSALACTFISLFFSPIRFSMLPFALCSLLFALWSSLALAAPSVATAVFPFQIFYLKRSLKRSKRNCFKYFCAAF